MQIPSNETNAIQSQTDFIAPDGMIFSRVNGIDSLTGVAYSGFLSHDHTKFIHDGDDWTLSEANSTQPAQSEPNNDFVVEIIDAVETRENVGATAVSHETTTKHMLLNRREALQLAVHNYILGDKDTKKKLGGIVVGMAMRRRSAQVLATKATPLLALVGLAVPGPVDEAVLAAVIIATAKGVSKEYKMLRAG